MTVPSSLGDSVVIVHIYERICVRIYMYVCVCVCMYVCVYVCMYVYIYVPPIHHAFIHTGMDIYLSEWMEKKEPEMENGKMMCVSFPLSHRRPGLLAC